MRVLIGALAVVGLLALATGLVFFVMAHLDEWIGRGS